MDPEDKTPHMDVDAFKDLTADNAHQLSLGLSNLIVKAAKHMLI